MRGINRKTADPEILKHYENMRHERRYPTLELAVNITRLLAYGGVFVVLFLPAEVRSDWALAWGVLVVAAIIMEFALMIIWQPRGKKLRTLAIIIAVLALVALASAALL